VKIRISALIPTACLGVISILFSAIVGMTMRYKLIYGSLASIIILMVWLYFCSIIIILGGALETVVLRYKENPNRPMLMKGTEIAGLKFWK
jgi:uncharacterized BrkB/YihY/UPF0761 family membrane protein